MTDKELNAKIVDLVQQQIRKLVSFEITCPYCGKKYTIDELSNWGDDTNDPNNRNG